MLSYRARSGYTDQNDVKYWGASEVSILSEKKEKNSQVGAQKEIIYLLKKYSKQI